jgi:hypothetical protein
MFAMAVVSVTSNTRFTTSTPGSAGPAGGGPARDLHDQLVATLWAEPVVDVLEAVDVEHERGPSGP